jgi:hypothetical protein
MHVHLYKYLFSMINTRSFTLCQSYIQENKL